MKLTSTPKPVKFRIVSGGEEHSSIDSLRQNFCINDLQDIDNQLLRWLERQKDGKEIANEIKQMENFDRCDSLEDYCKVYKIFFPDFQVLNSLAEMQKWFEEKKQDKNVEWIKQVRLKVDEEYVLTYIGKMLDEKQPISERLLSIMEEAQSHKTACYFMLARYRYEYKKSKRDILGGKDIIKALQEQNYPPAKKYKLFLTTDWSGIDKEFMKKYIRGVTDNSHFWTYKEENLKTFINNAHKIQGAGLPIERDIQQIGLYPIRFDATSDEAQTDFLYYHKWFFVALGFEKDNIGKDILEQLAEVCYYPAMYLLDNNEKHEILDKDFFREITYQKQAEVFLENIFEF